MFKQQNFRIPIGFDMYFFLSITTKQLVLLTDLKSRRCSSISLRLLRSVKPETGVDRILLDAEVFLNTHASQRECQPSYSTGMKKDKRCCYVSFSRWTKELQRTVSAFNCKTCNNVNVVGVLRFDQTGNDDDDMHGMNSISAKVDVGESSLSHGDLGFNGEKLCSSSVFHQPVVSTLVSVTILFDLTEDTTAANRSSSSSGQIDF
ncbi:hypothetical protein DY000_02054016 [Brassica cretica]|uniref:Uncharacterized protein n=1 Tax=Brassica cretica TaxID=69181 RepID=A0ABQ7AAB2_BRACR|nr:hypothetical protein DY000_02054016 [Brassica cretica]